MNILVHTKEVERKETSRKERRTLRDIYENHKGEQRKYMNP